MCVHGCVFEALSCCAGAVVRLWPHPVALGPEGLLLDGCRIAPARLLGVERAAEGATVQIDWHGWLLERRIPTGAVAEALLVRFFQ